MRCSKFNAWAWAGTRDGLAPHSGRELKCYWLPDCTETWVSYSSIDHFFSNILNVFIHFLYRDEVITKLEEVILKIVQDLSQEKSPSLKYNSRNSWKNTRFG